MTDSTLLRILGGFKPDGDIRLGTTIFNSYDGYGVAWVVTDLDGWWELPDLTLPDDPRPYELDGSYITPGRYNARTISLVGTLVPPPSVSPTAREDGINAQDLASYARDLLGSGIDLVRQSGVLAVDEVVPKRAEVQLNGRPSFKSGKINGTVEFQIPLRAPDPRKYSQRLNQVGSISSVSSGTSGGSVVIAELVTQATPNTTITNIGTYDTGGIIVIKGPVTNPLIYHVESDRYIQIVDTVPSGHFYLLDLINRYLLYDGVLSRRSKIALGSKWFLLQPGENTVEYNGTAIVPGSTSATIWFRSAWIY